ncbi:MAG: DUF2147 domain-containing protein [Sulfitobacter sp.]
MNIRKILILFGFVGAIAGPAQADAPLGLWQAAPDGRGLVVHVRTRPCGSSICGRVERAKNLRGYDTPSSAVGQQVLWDVNMQDDGSYLGQLWASDSGQRSVARLKPQGNQMQVETCVGSDCKAEIWKRLR